MINAQQAKDQVDLLLTQYRTYLSKEFPNQFASYNEGETSLNRNSVEQPATRGDDQATSKDIRPTDTYELKAIQHAKFLKEIVKIEQTLKKMQQVQEPFATSPNYSSENLKTLSQQIGELEKIVHDKKFKEHTQQHRKILSHLAHKVIVFLATPVFILFNICAGKTVVPDDHRFYWHAKSFQLTSSLLKKLQTFNQAVNASDGPESSSAKVPGSSINMFSNPSTLMQQTIHLDSDKSQDYSPVVEATA